MVLIAFIGPRGVGKSTIAEELAKDIKFKFVEFDTIIGDYLKDEGGIFSYGNKHGWKNYMQVLYKVIVSFINNNLHKNLVIDFGGGTTMSEYQESKLIYNFLKDKVRFVLILPDKNDSVSIDIITKREIHRRDTISYYMTGISDEDMKKKVIEDYNNRVPMFRKQAEFIIYNNKSIEVGKNLVLSELKIRNII